MSGDPRERAAGSFTAELFALLDALRALVGGHVALLRAEIGAIVRDLVGLVIGVIVVASLLITALVALLVALALTLGELLYGSSLWGAAHLVIALLAVATGILSSLLRIDRSRRGRSLLIAFVIGAAVGAALLGALNWSLGPALGLAVTVALAALLIDLLVGLASFDAQRFTDRFRPLASEAEFRATMDAVEGLREEVIAGAAGEVGAAIGSADEALGAIRSGTATLADALRRVADRLRDRDAKGEGDPR
ncbi:MAG: hypothetical protein DWI45_01405 [Chloroflexi bacterium]|nr:MAG: hypothetical protein DWI45_01405 [Chloroflexota bacterium]